MAKGICTLEFCDRPHYARGWCKGHYQRWMMGLDPNKRLNGTLTLAERFWAKVDIAGPEDCWLWKASISPTTGYGQFDWPRSTVRNGRSILTAHRIALALHDGIDPPVGLHCAHSCDNRPCVNPAHLRWATPRENEGDKVLRHRQAVGSSHGSAKLTEAQVLEMRRLREEGVWYRDLANLFGVAYCTVQRICCRQTWTHI